MNQLVGYIKKVKSRGYTDSQIHNFLLKYGYTKKQINAAMKEIGPQIVPNLSKPQNPSRDYLDQNKKQNKEKINLPEGQTPTQIKIVGISNYIAGLLCLIFGAIFSSLIIDMGVIMDYIVKMLGTVLSILFIYAGYLVSTNKAGAKLFSAIPSFILILICVIMLYVETMNTNIFGMMYYFLILVLPLWNVYVLYDKKFAAHFE